MRVYLIRHGQTAWNIAGKTQGHTDIPLDEIGLDQARCVGERFDGVHVDRVISSDLTRARQTAEPVVAKTGAPFELLPALRERSFGEWEGSPYSFVTQSMIDLAIERGVTRSEIAPPGGESFRDIWQRMLPVSERLLQSDETTVVVSHGAASCVLLAQLVAGTLATAMAFKFPNCAITELELRRESGVYLINRYADTSHLQAMSDGVPF